jgi:hypothetical protein
MSKNEKPQKKRITQKHGKKKRQKHRKRIVDILQLGNH